MATHRTPSNTNNLTTTPLPEGKQMKYKLKREGSTLYALNKDGTNAFSMQVQEGFNDVGERLTPEQTEAIAVGIMYGLECHTLVGCRVDFSAIIDNQ